MTLVFSIALGALSGCGKKGSLEPPDGKPDKYPKQYPDPSTL
jgi:predicted small lipoprotein YifL